MSVVWTKYLQVVSGEQLRESFYAASGGGTLFRELVSYIEPIPSAGFLSSEAAAASGKAKICAEAMIYVPSLLLTSLTWVSESVFQNNEKLEELWSATISGHKIYRATTQFLDKSLQPSKATSANPQVVMKGCKALSQSMVLGA
jgi:hypothetical protein